MNLDGRSALDSDRLRAAAILFAGLVPWTVTPYEAGFSYVFSFGLLNPGTGPLTLVPVTRYVFIETQGLPPSLLAWPVASLLYALGVGSASLSVADREDRRLTAGLFALATIDLLYFAVTFSARRVGTTAIPVGAVFLAAAAWLSRP